MREISSTLCIIIISHRHCHCSTLHCECTEWWLRMQCWPGLYPNGFVDIGSIRRNSQSIWNHTTVRGIFTCNPNRIILNQKHGLIFLVNVAQILRGKVIRSWAFSGNQESWTIYFVFIRFIRLFRRRRFHVKFSFVQYSSKSWNYKRISIQSSARGFQH